MFYKWYESFVMWHMYNIYIYKSYFFFYRLISRLRVYNIVYWKWMNKEKKIIGSNSNGYKNSPLFLI